MQAKQQRTVQPFQVDGYFSLYQSSRASNFNTALALWTRETVKNGFEAGATKVAVIVEDKYLSTSDNGTGMLPETMERHFSTLHSSGKRIGSSKNFGLGAKSAWMGLDSPFMWVVSSFKEKEGVPHEMVLARIRDQDAEATDGYIHGVVSNTDGSFVKPVSNDLGQWSTVIRVELPWSVDEEVILKAINGRFLETSVPTTVEFKKNQKTETKRAFGYADCMRRAVQQVYQHELRSCKLTWGRKTLRRQDREALEGEWEGHTLAFAYQGEIFKTLNGEKAARWLDGAGIGIGSSELYLVIELTPHPNYLWSTSRDSVRGAELADIQIELAKELQPEGVLHELRTFLEWFETQNTTSAADFAERMRTGIKNIKDIFKSLSWDEVISGQPGVLVDSSPKTEAERAKQERSGKNGDRKRPHRGFPEPVLADKQLTGGHAVYYSRTQNKLYIWPGHQIFADHLAKLRSKRDRDIVLELLALEVFAKVVSTQQEHGEVEQSVIDILVTGCTNFQLACHLGPKAKMADLLSRKLS